MCTYAYSCAHVHTHTHTHARKRNHGAVHRTALSSFPHLLPSPPPLVHAELRDHISTFYSFLVFKLAQSTGCHSWDVLSMKLRLEEKRPDLHGQQATHAVKQALLGEQVVQSSHKDLQLILCRPNFIIWTIVDSCCIVRTFECNYLVRKAIS